jgi:hypothetical protein
MGAFFVNYQIRHDDQTAVVDAAGLLVQRHAYISPPKHGWVTLYDEVSDSQDAHEIGRLGSDLSATLNAAVFAFIVSDSTLLVYYLFDNGDLLDEYHSDPIETSEHAQADQKLRFTGRPEILLPYCVPGTDRHEIETPLLRGQSRKAQSRVDTGFAASPSAEERLHPLVIALKMDEQRTKMGFVDFDRQWSNIEEGSLFLKIDGRKCRRPVARRVPPPIPPR